MPDHITPSGIASHFHHFVLVCAGFIGASVAQGLLEAGCEVLGVDSLNDYYDVGLKQYRLKPLLNHSRFSFFQGDLSDGQIVDLLPAQHDFDCVLHLAAQAGVRYCLENPGAYIQSNIVSFQHLVGACRAKPPAHLVFASSSSVYGNSDREWFSETDPNDTPVSLYAATKKFNEIVARSYAHLHGLPSTGLRFFTVYGPAGRPDMAYFVFTKAIVGGRPIQVFNEGQLERDFTYVDDIASGVVAAAATPPLDLEVPYRLPNLGNHQPVKLADFIGTLEGLLGKEAYKQLAGMRPDDV